MTLTELQEWVADFVNKNQLEAPVENRLLDLVSEVGELAKELLKGSQYGHQSLKLTSEWPNELADVFFALICIANSTGVDLEKGLTDALAKYQERLIQSGDAGSGR